MFDPFHLMLVNTINFTHPKSTKVALLLSPIDTLLEWSFFARWRYQLRFVHL